MFTVVYALPAAGGAAVVPSAFAQSSLAQDIIDSAQQEADSTASGSILDNNNEFRDDGTIVDQDNTADQDAANLGTQDQDAEQEQDTEQDAAQEDFDVQVGEALQQSQQQPLQTEPPEEEPPEEDATPPTLIVPEDITAEATSTDGAVVRFTITAQDNVDGTATLDENNILTQDDGVGGDITIICSPPSGFEFPIGTTEVECTATDQAGNTAIASFTITVEVPPTEEIVENIAFVSYRDGGNGEIYVMNADGSEQTRLTNNPASDLAPAWSPDGSKIAFESNRDGNYEIYVMNADGSEQTRLTNNPASENAAAWSPDGSKIAFISDREGNFEIYVMNADDGSRVTRLTYNAALDSNPSWSPDGSKIAFRSDRDGNREIYVMNAEDGSEQTRLTNNPATDSFPTWSPDGSKIAFHSIRDGNFEIYVMNAEDGSEQTNISNNPATDHAPDWGPAPDTD